MNDNVGAPGLEEKRDAIVARDLAVVGSRAARARLARGARRDARPLSGLALRSAAAADDRAGGDALLPGLRREMADCRGSRRRAARGGDQRLRRPRLLFSRAKPARLRQSDRRARADEFPSDEAALRALPGVGAYTAAAIAAIAFDRPGGAGRRQHRPHRRPPRRRSKRRSPSRASAIAAAARGARSARPRRRLRPGADGHRRDDLPAARPACPACPLSAGLRRVRARGAPETYPRRAPREGEAERARRRLLRAPGRRRVSRAPPAAEGAARLDRRASRHGLDGRGAGRGLGGRRADRRALAPPARRRRQVFTHFALTCVYSAPYEGGAPEQCFWVTREAVAEAGFSNVMRKAVTHAIAAPGGRSG